MAWNLYESKLPDAAKAYLSVLSSCGDEARACEEACVTPGDVARWSREPEYAENLRAALEHYESWKGWDAETWLQDEPVKREDGTIPLEEMPVQRPRVFQPGTGDGDFVMTRGGA